MQTTGIQRSIQVLLILTLAIAGLYFAKSFLIPLCLAGLFAMLFLPFCQWMERKGLYRGLAVVICIFTFLMTLAAIVVLIRWQVSSLTEDIGNIEERVETTWDKLSEYITETFGISRERQDKMIKDQSETAGGLLARFGISVMDVLVNFILMLVYIFLLMFYRTKIKKFILRIIPKKEDANARDAIDSIQKISQQYLTGMGIMIVCLWIMYGIGFSIIGLRNPFFFAIICGLLELIPFVGNFTGNVLASLMAITQGGGISMVVAILIGYAIIQFFQTYILEPLVVGTEVNINPMFTIMGLVVGDLIWGISGLVLAIPLMGILKIIFDHIPSMKPYGELMGRDKKKGGNVVEKIKGWFRKKK